MTESQVVSVPVYQEYMNPLLEALRSQGQALPIEEIDRLVIAAMKLSADIVAIPHDPEKPDRGEVSYRMAWARTFLKKAGLLENFPRGHWAISEKGRDAGTIDAHQLATDVLQALPKSTKSDEPTPPDEVDEELLTARVGDELGRQIGVLHRQLTVDGQLLGAEDAARSYARFRELFGPDILAGLDGQNLLDKMHSRGTKDSLVYWLEFKDDDEFPARFGSIGGGSALKFGMYWAADTKQWMGGSGNQQSRLTTDEAVARARTQRDQLLAGARVLAGVPTDPGRAAQKVDQYAARKVDHSRAVHSIRSSAFF